MNYLDISLAIIKSFRSVPGNITRGLSSDRNYEVGMMTEGNIPGKKKSKKTQPILCLLPGYIEFSRDTKREGLKAEKRCHFAMASFSDDTKPF